jgi:hypothetical protein
LLHFDEEGNLIRVEKGQGEPIVKSSSVMNFKSPIDEDEYLRVDNVCKETVISFDPPSEQDFAMKHEAQSQQNSTLELPINPFEKIDQ